MFITVRPADTSSKDVLFKPADTSSKVVLFTLLIRLLKTSSLSLLIRLLKTSCLSLLATHLFNPDGILFAAGYVAMSNYSAKIDDSMLIESGNASVTFFVPKYVLDAVLLKWPDQLKFDVF